MATDAHLIIDARPDGLPDAPGYYRTFPREPSPLGDLTLSAQKTTAMMNTSLDAVFDAMLKAGADAIVVLVCHAYQHGMLMPIAPGGSQVFADVGNLAIIDQVIAADKEAARIRTMPTTTPKEQQDVIDAWTKLLNSLQPGAVHGTITVKEAEDFLAKWVDMVATKLEFTGKPSRNALRRFIEKLQKVRNLKLSRVELRACNIGDDKVTMEKVRKFLNANHLTAPMVGTFFMSSLPVVTMAQVGQPAPARRHRKGVLGTGRLPGPTHGATMRDIISSGTILAQEDHTTRGFLKQTMVPIEQAPGPRGGLHLGAVVSYFALTLTVDEVRAFHYTGSVAVVSTGDGVTQDWTIVRRFVKGWILPDAAYRSGPFPVAGLWTKTLDMPDLLFVLPNETSYTRLMEQVP